MQTIKNVLLERSICPVCRSSEQAYFLDYGDVLIWIHKYHYNKDRFIVDKLCSKPAWDKRSW